MSPPSEPRTTFLAIWRTRPSRRQADRKLAGVAAAIARRYDIDPVLVRIAFVVAAFYGVGILLYLGAWMALPPDPKDPPQGPLMSQGSGTHPVVLIAAVIAALAGAGSLLSGDPGVLVGLAVVGGLLYLLHQARSERGLTEAATARGLAPEEHKAAPETSTAPSAPSHTTLPDRPPQAPHDAPEGGESGGVVAPTSSSPSLAEGTTEQSPRKPPAWDPLGAAPFAWDLPEPSPKPAQRSPRPRPVLTLATIGCALLAGGLTAAIALSTSGLVGVRIVFGVMLAVVGLGLVIGAFRHTGRGLIAVALPLVLLSYPVTKGVTEQWKGTGDLTAAPATVAELAPSYQRSVGTITLDLRRLDLSAPAASPATPIAPAAPPPGPVVEVPGGQPAAPRPGSVVEIPGGQPVAPPAAPTAPVPVLGAPVEAVPPAGAPLAGEPARTRIVLDAGEVTVLLPRNADVRVHCRVDIGELDCLDEEGNPDGATAEATVTDLGADGVSGGRPLELDVYVRTGTVEVRRG